MLTLSLFPGIGLLDRAFEEEGFCVVRGPDLLWGGDIEHFHPPARRFDGVIGGPPCQLFSPLQRLAEHNRAKARAAGDTTSYPVPKDLIPEFCRVVAEAAPQWFLMENVPAAPEPAVTGYTVQSIILNNRWCGGEQNRKRRFSFGWGAGTTPPFSVPGEVFEPIDYQNAVTASGNVWDPTRCGGKGGVSGAKTTAYLKTALAAQGLPPDFLRHAPFTVRGKVQAVGNGVPLPMGRAVARAVRAAYDER